MARKKKVATENLIDSNEEPMESLITITDAPPQDGVCISSFSFNDDMKKEFKKLNNRDNCDAECKEQIINDKDNTIAESSSENLDNPASSTVSLSANAADVSSKNSDKAASSTANLADTAADISLDNLDKSNSSTVNLSDTVADSDSDFNKSQSSSNKSNSSESVKNSCNLSSVPLELSNYKDNIFDNRKTPIANGAAPAIDGEIPTLKRTYTLRDSTIRKLNAIKAAHPDMSICISSIVDLAIEHYYDYLNDEN